MLRNLRITLFLLATLLIVAACSGSRASKIPAAGGASAPDLVVRRGEFRDRFVLTGELEAVRSADIVVPRAPSWEVQIRWMERDGAKVEPGQKVLEFDLSTFTGQLEEKRLAVAQAENELDRQIASAAAAAAQGRFELEQKQSELEKARIAADVPAELLSGREHQDRQLRLTRAQAEYAKSKETFDAQREGERQEEAVRRIALKKARREIEVGEQAMSAFTLSAPRAGILVVNEHPWEGRKFQVGDSAWVGLAVMRIPDLTEMQVSGLLMDVDDGRIQSGMSARCVVDAWPDLEFPGVVGKITSIAQEVDRRSQRRAFKVAIALDRSDPERMRPGMSVKVQIEKPPVPGALLAPRAALDLSAQPPKAVLADGTRREVQLGACNGLDCVVESGLEEGERLGSRG